MTGIGSSAVSEDPGSDIGRVWQSPDFSPTRSPNRVTQPQTAPVESRPLEWTVVSWNVLGARRPDLSRLADVLAERSPDVVMLQEVQRGQAEELARRLGMRFTWAFKHNPWRPFFSAWAEGAAILTPHQLGAPAHTQISTAGSKRSWRRRILQWALVGRDDRSAYLVYNAHLTPDAQESEARMGEGRRIAEIVAENGDSPPAIIGGDMNADVGESVLDVIPGRRAETSATNPADAPVVTIDHVVVPDAATVVSADVPEGGAEWRELSDHLPVTVTFSLDWVDGDWVG